MYLYSILSCYIVLYCIILYCFVLYCVVLYCLFCTLFYFLFASSVVDYSIRYFMNRIDMIGAPNYIPSVEDVLNVKVKTLGIVECDFFVKAIHVRLVDVGGQKNERRKWIHAFQDVTAIVYVVALTDFAEVLEEDGEVKKKTNMFFCCV
jgi:hypothetical protein